MSKQQTKIEKIQIFDEESWDNIALPEKVIFLELKEKINQLIDSHTASVESGEEKNIIFGNHCFKCYYGVPIPTCHNNLCDCHIVKCDKSQPTEIPSNARRTGDLGLVNTTQPSSTWEEEFQDIMTLFIRKGSSVKNIKTFVQNLLTTEKAAERKRIVEGIKKIDFQRRACLRF